MAIRKIIKKGNPVLKMKCHPVTKFDERLGSILDDMKETLLESNGVGLAAPQIGLVRRYAIVWDINQEDKEKDPVIYELINPEIMETSEETEIAPEGCLSVPGKYGTVERPCWVKVRAQDRTGKFYEVEGTGIVARCFCHEIDHLDGHIFTEKVIKYLEPEEQS